jgi:hypothetical protein
MPYFTFEEPDRKSNVNIEATEEKEKEEVEK